MSRRRAKSITPSYFQWRDGRPRWEPGPGLRDKGFKGRDLKDAAGQWLGLEAAIAAANTLNTEIKSGAPARPRITRKPVRTAQHLFEIYIDTPEFRLLAPTTQADYKCKANVFLATFRGEPVAAIGRAALKKFWRELYKERGHHMANGVLAVVRTMLTEAMDLEWISSNPAFKLKLRTPPPRLKLWLPEDVAAIAATADAMAETAVADAVIAALHSGQRQGDVLALPIRIFVEERIRLSQAKMRGKSRIDAPMTPALSSRVAEIHARRRALSNVVNLEAPLISYPGTLEPYTGDAFRKAFAAVRAEAARQRPEVAGLRFQDLRDTAVTRLALADCSLPQIAAITGHELTSITNVIRHYLVLQPAMADTAIAKLSTWLTANAIAL